MKLKILAMVVVLTCVIASVAIATTITPLAMSNRALGGRDLNQYTVGVVGGFGPNNIGLLVRTWGKVTWVDTANQYFYIDDGSGLKDGTLRTDGTAVTGIRVSYGGLAQGVAAVTPPITNAYAVVTGICSTVRGIVGTEVRPNLRVRNGSDILSFH